MISVAGLEEAGLEVKLCLPRYILAVLNGDGKGRMLGGRVDESAKKGNHSVDSDRYKAGIDAGGPCYEQRRLLTVTSMRLCQR